MFIDFYNSDKICYNIVGEKMKDIKIMFMGTPVFAGEILEYLNELGYNIVSSVSQPNRLVGRKQQLMKTAVCEVSEKLNIQCFQPEDIRKEKDLILKQDIDMIITCAYGQIIPKEILDHPKLGCFNIHASLLPRLRGGAPIHKAIMYQEKQTGITIMEMSTKMDAGAMILKKAMDLDIDYTYESLSIQLIKLAKLAIKEALPLLISGGYPREIQDENQVSYAYNVSSEEEYISFDRDYETVLSHINSLIDSPVGYGIVDNQNIKIHKIRRSNDIYEAENGFIIGRVSKGLGVVVENKILIIDKLQLENKRVMSALDFLNGAGRNFINKRFE